MLSAIAMSVVKKGNIMIMTWILLRVTAKCEENRLIDFSTHIVLNDVIVDQKKTARF
jgi:hypothetical protein